MWVGSRAGQGPRPSYHNPIFDMLEISLDDMSAVLSWGFSFLLISGGPVVLHLLSPRSTLIVCSFSRHRQVSPFLKVLERLTGVTNNTMSPLVEISSFPPSFYIILRFSDVSGILLPNYSDIAHALDV